MGKEEKNTARKQDDPLKDFNLNSVVEVKFEAGFRSQKYKTDFDDDFIEIDFLQKKANIFMRPNVLPSPRGILNRKKEKILEVLVPMMPATRRLFWTSIPESDNVRDLNQEIDVNDF